MNPTIAFLLGCIPFRLAIVVATMFASPMALKIFSIMAFLIASGFWLIFIFGWRKTGPETNGAPIWWNMLRPIHGTLWGIAAYFAWKGHRDIVWRVLLVDVCLGLVSFTVNKII